MSELLLKVGKFSKNGLQRYIFGARVNSRARTNFAKMKIYDNFNISARGRMKILKTRKLWFFEVFSRFQACLRRAKKSLGKY